ncbi:reverse transcriptase [Hamiltosporidium tvaerminnensis]|uniref:Reverse transcriptase n=1 Tax=Hamiltosporidium tvaerminnensis TaxID=1176355 RepID=A0A4Q9KXB1_9MICR|nr:reverse transcriptase [Hamiltosporidium tvaerminnensis]
MAMNSIVENSSKNLINLDFIDENTAEIICTENNKQVLINVLTSLSATLLQQSPEIDRNKIFNNKNFKLRMEKILKRKNNQNVKLKKLAVKLTTLEENCDSNDIEILNNNTNHYIDKNIIVVGDYNLVQNQSLEQDVLDNHLQFGLSEIYLHSDTFRQNNRSSTPDKVFSNCPIIVETEEIKDINHSLIIIELPSLTGNVPPKFKINLLKEKIIATKIAKKIQSLTTKHKNLINNLNVEDRCNLLHHIILTATNSLRIRVRKQDRLNPIIQQIRIMRDEARENNNVDLYKELRRDIKRLKKRFNTLDVPVARTKFIGITASELEKILKFHGTEQPKTNQNYKELLDTFILDGNLQDIEQTKEEISDFFKNTLKERYLNMTNIIKGITDNEVIKVIKTLKTGKSGGLTGIRNEFLKICPANFIHELTTLYNMIILTKEIPSVWKRHRIQPIPKDKGEFRPISLIEKTRKLFEKLIFLNFIPKLHKQQAGFRPQYSTLNHALTIDTLLRHSNGELTCVTLDIKKAYDCVDRKFLYKKLIINQNFSLHDTILIASLIENNEYTISSEKDFNTYKTAPLGLPQGSIISPTLFNIFIDDIIDYVPETLRDSVFMYADDIIICNNNLKNIQEILKGVLTHADENNYKLNPKKCFYNAAKAHEIIIYDTIITKQNPLKYLGYYFNNRCADVNMTIKIIRQKMTKAAAITNKSMLRNIYTSNDKLYQLKLRAYIAYVRPHIDYHAVLLGCNKTFNQAADRIQKGILKYLFKIYYKTPSKIIYALFPVENITQRAEKLRYAAAIRFSTNTDTIIGKFYARFESKNMLNYKIIVIAVESRYPDDNFKMRYEKLKKENLKLNLLIFDRIPQLKSYNFKIQTRMSFGIFLEIIRPVHKRDEMDEIINLFSAVEITQYLQ